jgi:hypothetical protein
MYIDIKTSPNNIRENGRATGKKAHRNNEGIIVMQSLIKDHEFNGRVYISDEAADEKVPELLRLLEQESGYQLEKERISA